MYLAFMPQSVNFVEVTHINRPAVYTIAIK